MSADWIPADWPAPDAVVAGCTTRRGGVSEGAFASLNLGDHVGDMPAKVSENRQRFALDHELPADPAWLTQEHGAQIRRDPQSGTSADAACSRKTDTVCAIMIADCLPVLFTNRDGTEIAAAHAGWRGLAAGILENAVASFDSAPADLMAWLGPAISQRAFEVGDEVRAVFTESDPGAADCFVANERRRWQADLCALARRRLETVGVSQVFGGQFCTFTDAERFFSYRRDGSCGRMAAFIWRRK